MDEPLSNLDARLRMWMRRELTRLHRHLGVTSIYPRSDGGDDARRSDRGHEERRRQIGTPRELYYGPVNLFVARFIGSPPMSLIPVRVSTHGLGLSTPTVPGG